MLFSAWTNHGCLEIFLKKALFNLLNTTAIYYPRDSLSPGEDHWELLYTQSYINLKASPIKM